MSDLTKSMLTGAIIGAVLATAWLYSDDCHASNAQANHGHHSGGNMGAVGAAAGAFGGSANAMGSSAGSAGNGGSYGDWYLRTSPVDNYQPWPQEQMHQFQKP